jgi:hypothetical protein
MMTQSASVLRISARNLEPDVKYNHFKQINSKEENKPLLHQSVFHLQNIQEGVKQLNKERRKKYLKIAKATLLTSLSIYMLVDPLLVSAQVPTAVMATASLVASTPTPEMITPSDIVKVGLILIGLTAISGIVLSIILYQVSGAYRMLRNSKEATEWQVDIRKGISDILIAPVIILAIAMMAFLLFSGLPFFPKIL